MLLFYSLVENFVIVLSELMNILYREKSILNEIYCDRKETPHPFFTCFKLERF